MKIKLDEKYSGRLVEVLSASGILQTRFRGKELTGASDAEVWMRARLQSASSSLRIWIFRYARLCARMHNGILLVACESGKKAVQTACGAFSD